MLVLGLIDIPVWVILLVAVVVLLYYCGTYPYGAFKGTGIPGPKPWPFIGNTGQAILQGFMTYDLKLKKKYGDVIGLFTGLQPEIMLYDYEMISHVTVKQFQHFTNRRAFETGDKTIDCMLTNLKDEQWKHARSTMSPTFTTGKLRKMAKEINRCAKQLKDNLTALNEPFEAKDCAGAFTLDVIASTAFGLRVSSQEEKDNAFVKHAKKIMNIGFKNPVFFIMILFPKMSRYIQKLGFGIFSKNSREFFMEVIRQTVDARQGGDKSRSDFIQLMSNAQSGEAIYEKGDEEEVEQHKTDISKTGLSRDEVLSNALLFFLAGFETTALGLTYLMYCLACNPECQEKVIEEIDRILGDKEDVDYDSVMKMQYLEQCFQESLRIYPAAPRLDRVAKEDTVIKGVKFPKGMVAVVPVYALHHDPDTWPDPEKFDPERFSPEEKAKRNPITWLPFGFGPRNCIGMRLAIYEIKVAIVYILKTHKLVTCEKTQQPLKFSTDRWLQAVNGVWLDLEKRK